MDQLTPLPQHVRQLSQDDCSANTSVLQQLISSQSINPHTIANGGTTRNKLSSNARRLELRNAGFRAALLPARRLSTPQTNITSLAAGRTINDENGRVCMKTRDCSSSTNSPLNILREISNSARHNAIPPPPAGDVLGFADDEKENPSTDQSDTMIFKNGSIKSVKNRKKVRRIPNFQSAKYIEYLEHELGSTTERLDALQSPETVRGQAAKIRKLEKKIQELSQHLSDWERNHEERVNDQVFERLHGESSLRLKLLKLEEAAVHKDAHISELGKELEDVKVKLVESESGEGTLSRRVDVLTELLAKSPTRTSFSTYTTADIPSAVKSLQFAPSRVCVSPTRESLRINTLGETLRASEATRSTTTPAEGSTYQNDESVVETDTDSVELSISSRPVSGIFSSCSSQTSSSRPTSVFSIGSISIPSALEDKPYARPRRSRRFAPGSTGLKPLLLPTAAGLSEQANCSDTPKRDRQDNQSGSDSQWESAGELNLTTPSRPRIQRPYSWAHSPPVASHKSMLEDVESTFDTPIRADGETIELPLYLRHLAQQSRARSDFGSSVNDSPAQITRSLEQELQASQCLDRSHVTLDQVIQPSTIALAGERLAEHNHATVKKITVVRPSAQDIAHSDLALNSLGLLPTVQGSAFHDLGHCPSSKPLTTQIQQSYLASLVASLGQKPLHIARHVLMQSWTRGSVQFGGFAWWVLGFWTKPRHQRCTAIEGTVKNPSLLRNEQQLLLNHSRNDRTPTSEKVNSPLRAGLSSVLPQLQALAFCGASSKNKHHCPHCVEPPGRRKLRLWTKLVLALVLAVGYAILEGPAVILDTQNPGQESSDSIRPIEMNEE